MTTPRRSSEAPRRALPRALALVAACFVVSVGLRIADPGGAVAEEIRTVAATPAVAQTPLRPTPGCVPPEGTEALLAAIRDRESQLSARTRELDAREQVLSVARAKIEEQIVALTDAERRLAETLAIADKAAEQDIARLVAVYEAMKPAPAAQIFATMDIEFAAGFLARMKPEIAGAILAGIPAERAYAISATLAGRNARAPTE
jgi:flagellar motility protein MotE (MotC chaperone)